MELSTSNVRPLLKTAWPSSRWAAYSLTCTPRLGRGSLKHLGSCRVNVKCVSAGVREGQGSRYRETDWSLMCRQEPQKLQLVAAMPVPGNGQHCKQDPHPSLVMAIPPHSMGWGLRASPTLQSVAEPVAPRPSPFLPCWAAPHRPTDCC